MNELIERQIICAVRKLLTGRVNKILENSEILVPVIEFGNMQRGTSTPRTIGSAGLGAGSGSPYATAPVIALSSCERTEKERIIINDAYSLTITFALPENSDSELYCYAYAGAVSRALYDSPTLGGVANRATITGKKYNPPKKPNCGEGWEVVITLRVTIEGMRHAG